MAAVRRCGAIKDKYDSEDKTKIYSKIPLASSSMDLSKYVVRVYDQDQLNSCTANALCAAYGLDLKKQESTVGGFAYFNPSRLFLYYNTRTTQEDAGRDTTQEDAGASIRNTMKALNQKGVCEEKYWPYRICEYNTKPCDEAYYYAQGNTLCKYKRLMQDVNQLRACLHDDCPFIFGFNIYNKNFFYVSSPNVTIMPSQRPPCSGSRGLQ